MTIILWWRQYNVLKVCHIRKVETVCRTSALWTSEIELLRLSCLGHVPGLPRVPRVGLHTMYEGNQVECELLEEGYQTSDTRSLSTTWELWLQAQNNLREDSYILRILQ